MLAVRQRSGFCSFMKSVAKSVRPILRAYFFRQTKKRPTSGATAYYRKIKHTPPPRARRFLILRKANEAKTARQYLKYGERFEPDV